MANTTLNTRICLKRDTFGNWDAVKDTFVPLAGEPIVVVVPASAGAVVQEPATLMKIGDGTNAIKDLPYVSGLAADVYDWAKAEDKPEYSWDEIKDLVFHTAYNKDTNKVATMADVTGAIEGLTGAMHYIGTSIQDPTVETTPGTQDGADFSAEDKAAKPSLATYAPEAGDVVVYGTAEYVYDGVKWKLFGDEGSYAIKGSIKDADIAADAAIAKTKIAGEGAGKTLVDDLAAKADKVDSATDGNLAGLDADGNLTDSGKKAGGDELAATPDENTLATEKAVSKAIDDLADIASSGDAKDLKQTTGEYLILNCGSSTTVI